MFGSSDGNKNVPKVTSVFGKEEQKVQTEVFGLSPVQLRNKLMERLKVNEESHQQVHSDCPANKCFVVSVNLGLGLSYFGHWSKFIWASV